MGAIIAGALQGAGEAGVQSGLQMQKKLGEEDLIRLRAESEKDLANVRAQLERENYEHRVETDISARPRMQAAELPGELKKRKEFAAIDTDAKVEEFKKLAPLQREEAVKLAEQSLRAMTTPEMLRLTRAQAQAKHIVDPSYTLIPQGDGTLVAFDQRTGKNTGVLKGEDGKPLIRKDPEELKAVATALNAAGTNLRIEEAAFNAAMKDPSADDAAKAAAQAKFDAARADYERIKGPAMAVLFGKGKVDEAKTAPTTPAPKPKGQRKLDYGYVDPQNPDYRYIGKPGDNINDKKNWEYIKGKKPSQKSSGVINKQVPAGTDETYEYS